MSSTLAQQLSLADKVNIVIFSLLLVATIVLATLLQLYYRHLPEQQLNVLVRLQAHWNLPKNTQHHNPSTRHTNHLCGQQPELSR